jgi:hypothetical protein
MNRIPAAGMIFKASMKQTESMAEVNAAEKEKKVPSMVLPRAMTPSLKAAIR